MQTRYEPLGIGAGSLIAGRYEIERSLGSGGMAAVFRVIDRALNSQVCALKVFEPRLTKGEVDLERFRNEVLVTRKLTHPNIVRSFEFGQMGSGQFYLVMEYVPGKSLYDVIYSDDYKSLAFGQMIRYLTEICKGISYAHSVGVVHRDIKPANVLITNNGQVKITDFGLAQTLETAVRLTQTGECVGTPAYMSPEQLQGKQVDERADVYSMGILAYELVSGALPFAAPDWYTLASKIMTEPLPQLSNRKISVPHWFQQIVVKATAKNPDDRFQSVDELASLLDQHLTQSQDMIETRRMLSAEQLEGFEWMLGRLSSAVYRHAPSIAAVSAVLLLVATIVGTSNHSVKEVKATVEDSSSAIQRFAHTLHKLNDAVRQTYRNSEEINRFLEMRRRAGASPARAAKPDIDPEIDADLEADVEAINRIEAAPESTPASAADNPSADQPADTAAANPPPTEFNAQAAAQQAIMEILADKETRDAVTEKLFQDPQRELEEVE